MFHSVQDLALDLPAFLRLAITEQRNRCKGELPLMLVLPWGCVEALKWDDPESIGLDDSGLGIAFDQVRLFEAWGVDPAIVAADGHTEAL